jgi:hypothetical protein
MQEQLSLNEIPKRHCAKWSYNEIDKLHREFEIKQYTVEKIALEHERTPNAILFKLKSEGLLEKEETDDDDEESENEDSKTEDNEDYEEEESSDDTEDEDYEEESGEDESSDDDDESYANEEEDEEEEEEEEEEERGQEPLPCTYQINMFRTKPTNLVEKCIFTYCKAINLLVDVIFDTSYSAYRRVFVK